MSEEIINFSALERELRGALEADRKYQRENDAKFRALHQKVGSYEEFRDIVQASHLRPLDKTDKTGGPRRQPWNSLASSDSSSTSCSSSTSSSVTSCQQHHHPTVLSSECALPQTLPRTTCELSRVWRQLSGASRGRYRLLLALGGPALRDIFRAEIGSGLLGEMVVVLFEDLQPGDDDRVTKVLEGLSQTPRFSLNLALLSPSEKDACDRLLSLLATAAQRSLDHASHYRGRSREAGGEEKEGDEGSRGDAEEQGGRPLLLPPLLPLLLPPLLARAFEVLEDRENVFTRRACPAFLVFDNAAYLAGMTLELPCHCKPEQVLEVVWYYQRQLGDHGATRVLTDRHGSALMDSQQVVRGGDQRGRFSIRLFSLLVFRAQPEDSGHYLCGTTAGDFFYGYDVDVQEAQEVVLQGRETRHRRRRLKKKNSSPTAQNHTALYQVFSSYRTWSRCDRCGQAGEQTRVGLCYVWSPYLHVRYRGNDPNVLSCHSRGVPWRLGLSQEGAGRPLGATLGVRSCTVPCPPPRPPPPPQQQALLKFLGYGQSQGLRESIPIYHYNHPASTPLVLACPGARPQHAVAWDRGSSPIYRFQHMESINQTSPRLFIDPGNHLHLNPALQEDSGSYYCWLQGRRAAEIRLVVYLGLGHHRQLSDPDMVKALWVVLLCYAGLTGAFTLALLGRLALRPAPHQH